MSVGAALERLFQSVYELQQVPFLQRAWSYKTDVAFGAASATNVEHGLGRVPVGWLVLDANGVLLARTGPFTATTVELTNAAGAGTASILFF